MTWVRTQRRLAPVWSLVGTSALLSSASMLSRGAGVVSAGLFGVGAFMLMAAVLSFKAPERARLPNGVLIGVLGLFYGAQVVMLVSSFIGRAPLEPLMNLQLLHAVVTSVFFAWLVFLGLRLLKTKSGRPHPITPRLLGALLLTSAATHLYMATLPPPAEQFEVALGPLGVKVWGIPGWQAWHALSVAVALALFIPALVKGATTVLLVMVVALVPLYVVAAIGAADPVFSSPRVTGLGVVMTLVVAYLVWWLRESVSSSSSSSSSATAAT